MSVETQAAPAELPETVKPGEGDVEMANSSDASSNDDGTGLRFNEGDRVIAFHPPLWYRAKVLKKSREEGYFVHYDKWNSKWDEWVKPESVIEVNDESIKLMKETHAAVQRSASKRSVNASASAAHAAAVGGAGHKRKKLDTSGNTGAGGENDGEDAGDDDGADAPHVRVLLSEDLKSIVVRDWDQLTQNRKLCALPRSDQRTVHKIVDDFVNSRKKVAIYSQICEGLLVYFDRALPNILLYRCERPQYEKLREEHPNKRPCELYGGEHLLRLFVRLPQLLRNTDLSETETKTLCNKLQDLIKFLSKKTGDYFSPEKDYVDDSFASAEDASAPQAPAPVSATAEESASIAEASTEKPADVRAEKATTTATGTATEAPTVTTTTETKQEQEPAAKTV